MPASVIGDTAWRFEILSPAEAHEVRYPLLCVEWRLPPLRPLVERTDRAPTAVDGVAPLWPIELSLAADAGAICCVWPLLPPPGGGGEDLTADEWTVYLGMEYLRHVASPSSKQVIHLLQDACWIAARARADIVPPSERFEAVLAEFEEALDAGEQEVEWRDVAWLETRAAELLGPAARRSREFLRAYPGASFCRITSPTCHVRPTMFATGDARFRSEAMARGAESVVLKRALDWTGLCAEAVRLAGPPLGLDRASPELRQE